MPTPTESTGTAAAKQGASCEFVFPTFLQNLIQQLKTSPKPITTANWNLQTTQGPRYSNSTPIRASAISGGSGYLVVRLIGTYFKPQLEIISAGQMADAGIRNFVTWLVGEAPEITDVVYNPEKKGPTLSQLHFARRILEYSPLQSRIYQPLPFYQLFAERILKEDTGWSSLSTEVHEEDEKTGNEIVLSRILDPIDNFFGFLKLSVTWGKNVLHPDAVTVECRGYQSFSTKSIVLDLFDRGLETERQPDFFFVLAWWAYHAKTRVIVYLPKGNQCTNLLLNCPTSSSCQTDNSRTPECEWLTICVCPSQCIPVKPQATQAPRACTEALAALETTQRELGVRFEEFAVSKVETPQSIDELERACRVDLLRLHPEKHSQENRQKANQMATAYSRMLTACWASG